MSKLFGLLTVALIATLALANGASAQTPFASNQGIPAAQSTAEDSLGSDAMLVSVLTSGENPLTGGEAFDIETGESEGWIYFFYSPSQDRSAGVIVVQLVPGLFMTQGGVGDSVEGASDVMQLMANLPYSNSSDMARAIRSNADYQTYRTLNGTVFVSLAAYLKGTTPVPGMPNDFPLNDEIWTVGFQDDVDSTKQLICIVAASTGQTYCVSSEVAAIADEEARANVGMQLAPNPAAGRARVTVTAPQNGRSLDGVRLGLFDATGREVLDLTTSFAESGYRFAEFDATSLPAGSYFCRAVGNGYNGVLGTIVLGR
jgi:hypothetical protein